MRAPMWSYGFQRTVVSSSTSCSPRCLTRRMYSHQLDNLADVFCPVLVTRPLPGCEHEATMRCSDKPRNFACRATCSGVMACCGRSCKAQCHNCQVLNVAHQIPGVEDEPTIDEPTAVQRTNHVAHPCEKSLFCGHLCGKQCSDDHQCTVFCKAPCRQVCVHAHCRNFCSTPCAPCQEPCTWYVCLALVCSRSDTGSGTAPIRPVRSRVDR